MVLRVAFFILMALGLVGFGTVAWFSLRPPSSPVAASAVPQLAKKKALATARTVGAGTMLKPEDIVGKEVASGDIAGLLSADEPDAVRSLAGSMVKHAMSAGEPIRLDDVMKFLTQNR